MDTAPDMAILTLVPAPFVGVGLPSEGAARQVVLTGPSLVATLKAHAVALRACAANEAPRKGVGPLAPLAAPIAGKEVIKVLELQARPAAPSVPEVRAVGAAEERQALAADGPSGAALIVGPRAMDGRGGATPPVHEVQAGRNGVQVLLAPPLGVPRAEGVAEVIGARRLVGLGGAYGPGAANATYGAARGAGAGVTGPAGGAGPADAGPIRATLKGEAWVVPDASGVAAYGVEALQGPTQA